jgi:hypothetical protein
MDARNEIQDPFAISRMSPAERSQWQQRVIREAHTAQAAAVGELLVRVVAVMFRGVSVLVSSFRDAPVVRDASRPRASVRTASPACATPTRPR